MNLPTTLASFHQLCAVVVTEDLPSKMAFARRIITAQIENPLSVYDQMILSNDENWLTIYHDYVMGCAQQQLRAQHQEQPQYPTNSVGGSGAEILIKQWMAVMDACDALVTKLREAMPHQRDYQGGRDAVEAFLETQKSMRGDIQTVQNIRDGYERMAIAMFQPDPQITRK
jgi:hypothetical protein